MEPFDRRSNYFSRLLIVSALSLLMAGLLFGLLGAIQYMIPGFLKSYFSFEKVRPLHVSAVIFWIIMAAMGSVLTYLQWHTGKTLKYESWLRVMYPLLIVTILSILVSYIFGVFGGREYWEFHPALALPIVVCWIIYLVVFTGSVGSLNGQPVYVWMWLTGTLFFLFTFLESYLWVFPYFRNHVVHDMTIQWKSYGSMVGAWNMLIYGSSIFLMDRISMDKHYAHSKIAFALYFIGLFNLMFNWGHHIYTLPTHSYVQYISYFVSMTELLIIGRIIFLWKNSLTTAQKYFHQTTYRFLIAADVWVFLTLALAIMMSVPAINLYTHGTHITVAHTMGATIGINSMLLLAISYDILTKSAGMSANLKQYVNKGYWIANLSLFLFWITLIVIGVLKAQWQMSDERVVFGTMMNQLKPLFVVFFLTGLALVTGLLMVIIPLLKHQYEKQRILSYKPNLS